MKNTYKLFIIFLVFSTLLSSCLLLPISSSRSGSISVINNENNIEPIKRDEYELLNTVTAKTRGTRIYFLFIPLGKLKSDGQLKEDAYYKAVSETKDADGLVLPHYTIKKKVFPFLLINVIVREAQVSGRAIKLK